MQSATGYGPSALQSLGEFSKAESIMEEKWSVDKLDSSNWITWKFQMHHLLMAKGLWKYVDGSEVLAEDATDRA